MGMVKERIVETTYHTKIFKNVKTRFLYKFDGSKEIENTWWENWSGMNPY